MITRHGRSASTISTVLPNTDVPGTRRGSVQKIVGLGQSVAAAALAHEFEPQIFEFAQRQSNFGGRGAEFARQEGAGTQARVCEQAQRGESLRVHG